MPTGENLVGFFLFYARRERVRNGAEGRAGVSKAAGKGGVVRAKEGRRQIPALGSSIPDFCFPAPEMQFEPIKSMVSRGLSPIGVERGRKRSLKLVTQSPCHALPNFATIEVSTRQVRPKRRGAPARKLGLLHF